MRCHEVSHFTRDDATMTANRTTPWPDDNPDNSNDARLRAQVHPAHWLNPQPKQQYHLVVVGAGTGGLVTAAVAAGLGARVALIERHRMGGDCLNTGCVPSKAIIRAARSWHDAKTANAQFGGPVAHGDGNFAQAFERMREIRANIASADSAERFRAMGVDVLFGEAQIVSANALNVGGQGLKFRRAVIATGSRPSVPNIPGLAEIDFYTNENIFSLREQPRHLVIIGGGPVGCELAQAFVRFGTRVTLVARDAKLLPRDTADASRIVYDALVRDGVHVMTNANVVRVGRGVGDVADEEILRANHGSPAVGNGAIHAGVDAIHAGDDAEIVVRVADRDVMVRGDALLVAVGRTPNVEKLGLDAAAVKFDLQHGVHVDDRLRTSNHRVYAVGDVCSSLKLTHAADFQARMVVQNALFYGRKKCSALITPWVTFTSPEVAQVGLTEEAAAKSGMAVDVVNVPMHEVDRAELDGATEGFCRILIARGTDRIVGASVVSEHAGEHISAVALAMTNGLGLSAFARTMHPYPTQGEMLRKAADAWNRRKLTPAVKKLFAWYFRMVG